MGKPYIRTSTRIEVCEADMKKAMSDVLKNKMSIRTAANHHGVKKSTLFKRIKHFKKANNHLQNNGADDSGVSEDKTLMSSGLLENHRKKFYHRQIFNDIEEELTNYLIRSSEISCGLTYTHTRKLAYDYIIHIEKPCPSNWHKEKSASKDWMKLYMYRHPNLSLHKSENTSMARAIAFNKTNVTEFFKNYLHVLEKYKFPAHRIYNIDESSITTVMQAPKIIAPTGKKQVGQIVSAERGELVTFCRIINAAGNDIAPINSHHSEIWNSKENVQLIHLYREHKCFWNLRYKSYKRNDLKISAYQNISEKIKTKKIRNVEERNKIKQSKKSGSASEESYVPSIFWFNS